MVRTSSSPSEDVVDNLVEDKCDMFAEDKLPTRVLEDGEPSGPEEGAEEEAVPPTPNARDGDPETLSRISSGPAYSVFSPSMKNWIIGMMTVTSFVSPMTANIYFPALNAIAHDLGVSIGLINLTLTTYMILQGIAPTLFGDFGDMAGRRPAILVALAIYMGANIGLALQTNYVALLVLRCLQSTGSSGTLALGYAVVADISVSGDRGRYMGIVGAGINIGPAIGPVIGGILTEYLGWRSIFWFCLIYTAAFLIPYVLAVPETCRKVVGNGSIRPQGWNMTLIDYIRFRHHPPQDAGAAAAAARKLHFPNPLRALLLITEKDVGLILLSNVLLYLAFIITTATLGTIFAQIYPLDNLQIGLCYLPYGAGCCVAAISQGYVLDWNYRRIARRIGFTINYRKGDDLSKFPIERARIQPVYPLVCVGVVVTIGYGWALDARASLAVPLVLHFIIGLTITGSFSILNTLLVDLYPEAPATAVAANNLYRCTFGAAATAFIESMLAACGRGWTFTFLALLCAAVLPLVWLVVQKGPKWREQRRQRQLRAAQKEQEKAAK